jgi:hypothetical protein
VVARIDVAEPADVGRHRLVVPAIAAEQEFLQRQTPRGVDEEFLDPRLAVGKPVAEKCEVAGEALVVRNPVVGLRVHCIVDRHAQARAEAPVGGDHSVAAPIGQDGVVARHVAPERIVDVGGHRVERCRGVHIPEDDCAVRSAQLGDGALQLAVEHTDAAEFYDHVGVRGGLQRPLHRVDGGLEDGDLRPFRVVDVAVRLALEGVGFVKGELVTARGERLQQAAVIGGGAVPIGGDEARTEKGETHQTAFRRVSVFAAGASDATMPRSWSTR